MTKRKEIYSNGSLLKPILYVSTSAYTILFNTSGGTNEGYGTAEVGNTFGSGWLHRRNFNGTENQIPTLAFALAG